MISRSTLIDGESVIGRVGEHKVLICCDCGLVHDIWPSYDPSTKQVSIMFVRDSKETKVHRSKLLAKRAGAFKRWPRRNK